MAGRQAGSQTGRPKGSGAGGGGEEQMAGCKSATRRAQSDECATRGAEYGVIGKWERS